MDVHVGENNELRDEEKSIQACPARASSSIRLAGQPALSEAVTCQWLVFTDSPLCWTNSCQQTDAYLCLGHRLLSLFPWPLAEKSVQTQQCERRQDNRGKSWEEKVSGRRGTFCSGARMVSESFNQFEDFCIIVHQFLNNLKILTSSETKEQIQIILHYWTVAEGQISIRSIRTWPIWLRK